MYVFGYEKTRGSLKRYDFFEKIVVYFRISLFILEVLFLLHNGKSSEDFKILRIG